MFNPAYTWSVCQLQQILNSVTYIPLKCGKIQNRIFTIVSMQSFKSLASVNSFIMVWLTNVLLCKDGFVVSSF